MVKVLKKIISFLLISLFPIISFAESYDSANTIKVGYYTFPRYQEGQSDEDRKSGYGYEYLQKIASYTGWSYEYVYGERSDLMEQLKAGEVDILLGTPKPVANDSSVIYSRRPTVISTYYLFQSAAEPTISSVYPETFKGKKIGILEGFEGTESVLNYLNEKKIDCEIIYYSDYMKFRSGFFEKEFDAFVSTDLELSDNSYVSIIDTVGNHYLYAAISAKNPKIADKFNCAQEQLRETNPLYLENLNNKYFSSRISNLISNRKDFAWLKNNNKLVIGCADDYRPFCYEDPAGNFKGLLVDIIKQFGTFVSLDGITIEYKPYSDYTTAINDLLENKVDTVFPFYGDLYDAEKNNLQNSTEIYSLSMVLIGNKAIDYNKYKTLAVSKRSPVQDLYVRAIFPDAHIIYYDDFVDCIEAVKNFKVDATVANRFKATSYMNTNEYSTLDIIELKHECPVSFAVRRDSTDLLAMLNGCLLQVDDDLKSSSVYFNSYVTPKISAKEFIVQNALFFNILLTCIVLIVLCIAHFSVRRTKKHNELMRSQKRQLEFLLNEEKINTATISCISKMYICVYYVNLADYTFKEMDVTDYNIHDVIGSEGNAIERFKDMHANLVVPEHVAIMQKFDDLYTIKERLADKNYISQEFCGPHFGWCEAFFIDSGHRVSGEMSHVIYAVRSIKEEKELINRSNTDELTGCYNRRSFENDIHDLALKPLAKDLIVVSLDVNGLKNANDDIGHDAGDELIRGAANCIEKTFGKYGKVYRTGGDEFIACLNASEQEFQDIKEVFEERMNDWSGRLINKLSISYGAASVRGLPTKTINEIVKMSDKRMYEAKENFYSKKGVDRRSSQVAFETLSVTFNKILKINLATDIYTVMVMDESERVKSKAFGNTVSAWFKEFADSGMVHEDDREEFLEKTDINYMREYFRENTEPLRIHYKRIINENFKDSLLEIVPVKNFSEKNQIVFLYVKDIE